MPTYKAGKTASKATKLTASAKKKVIMSANGWTEQQYRNQYHLFKNKLRAYESMKIAHGVKVKIQSPSELLYAQAKSKLKYGSDYEPSAEMRQIQAMSAVSITKGRRLAADASSNYYKKRTREYEKRITSDFQALIDSVPKAREIAESVKDPYKRAEALAALADHIHELQKPSGSFIEGETFGSGDQGEDFDYSEWLDDTEEDY